MNPLAPIGVFDSGVGGLSILKTIRALLPQEHLYYVADSGHAPYGTKSPTYLQQRSLAIAQFLEAQGVKVIVVACNTATVTAVAHLRQQCSVPIVAVEPAIKPAVAATRSGVVGVMATARTLESEQFQTLQTRFASHVKVLTHPCPQLVQQVEAGDLSGPRTRQLIADYTAAMLIAGADTLVLGCTHYPFLRPAIQSVVGPATTLIDTGAAVSRQLKRVLQTTQLLGAHSAHGRVTFWTSGAPGMTQAVCDRLWEDHVTVEPLPRSFA